MKKIMMAAIVSLMMSGAAAAAGDSLEALRMESGLRFAESQTGPELNSEVPPVRLDPGAARAETAGYNAEARNYGDLAVTEPPPPVPAEDNVAESAGAATETAATPASSAMGLLLVSALLAYSTPTSAFLVAGIGAMAVGLLAVAAIVGIIAIASGAAAKAGPAPAAN